MFQLRDHVECQWVRSQSTNDGVSFCNDATEEKKPVHFVEHTFIDSIHVQQYNSLFYALFHTYIRMPSKGFGYTVAVTVYTGACEAGEIDAMHT